MHRRTPNIATALFVLALSFATRAELGDGFRSFPWGAEPTTGMHETTGKANMRGYQIPDENLDVLGTRASDITYYYYGGGLCRVEVGWWPQAKPVLEQIHSGLVNNWGDPQASKIRGGIYDIRWTSPSQITAGMLLALEEVRTPEEDWHITIIIQGRACSEAAINGTGL